MENRLTSILVIAGLVLAGLSILVLTASIISTLTNKGTGLPSLAESGTGEATTH